MTRRADIQGLRAVAVLMVVAYHAGLPVPGGFVGVDVFFVISGYVITALLQREWTAAGRIRFSRFYIRRFKRLTPALALMIVVTLVPAFLLIPPFETFQDTLATARGAMLLMANVVIARTIGDYFAAPAQYNPLLHTWSLSVEEQFYLVFPALMAFGWYLAAKGHRWKRIPILFIGIIAFVSFGLAVLGSIGYVLPHASWLLGFFSPFTRVWEFAFGATLALATTQLTVKNQSSVFALGLLGAGMLVASAFLITDMTPFPGPWTLLPVVGAALLLVVGRDNASAVTRGLSVRPMVKIGDLSYSIYLWHWPLIVFAGMLWPNQLWIPLCAAILSFPVALGSYTWIEQPIRDMPVGNKYYMTAFVLVCVLLPLGFVGFLSSLPQIQLLPANVKAAITLLSEEHAPSERGCMSTGPYTPGLINNCGWNLEARGVPIYLVGDSNAWHFAEAAIGAGKRLDRPVWVFTAPACPLINGVTVALLERSQFFPGQVGPETHAHCDAYVKYTLEWLRNAPPGIVFVAALDHYWWDPSMGVALQGGRMTSEVNQKAVILAMGLTSAVSVLRSAGHQVVLVQSIPTFRNPTPVWDPRTCSVLAIQNGMCSRTIPTAYIDNLQHISRATIDEVARNTGSSVLDLRHWFCDAEACSTDKPSPWQYRDAVHLTVAASQALALQFVAAIKAADESPVKSEN